MRGGWNSKGKTEADGIKRIAASFLRRNGYFSRQQSGTITWTSSWSGNKNSVSIEVSPFGDDKWLRIHYTQTDRDTGEKKDFDYKIPLITTPCRYGGTRYWFICPMSRNDRYCGRRVSVLYKDGDYFACRHCYSLTYASRNASGRYKGFVSMVDLDEMEMKVGRKYYAGKPTKKYKRLLGLEQRFEMGFIDMAARLEAGRKK
jgi:hypothetical protein